MNYTGADMQLREKADRLAAPYERIRELEAQYSRDLSRIAAQSKALTTAREALEQIRKDLQSARERITYSTNPLVLAITDATAALATIKEVQND